MCWRVEQRSDIGTFYYSSCVHDSYPVAHSCNDPKIVCDKDDGETSFLLNLSEQFQILELYGDIEGSSCLLYTSDAADE